MPAPAPDPTNKARAGTAALGTAALGTTALGTAALGTSAMRANEFDEHANDAKQEGSTLDIMLLGD